MSDYQVVAVVVDRDFGDRLFPLAQRLPIWICDTPINRQAAEKAWASVSSETVGNEAGMTTFRVGDNASPEDMIISHIEDIDLHHPTWSQIEVYGAALSEKLRVAWQQYGAEEFRATQEGFIILCASTASTIAK